jgi:hypothetical protein
MCIDYYITADTLVKASRERVVGYFDFGGGGRRFTKYMRSRNT